MIDTNIRFNSCVIVKAKKQKKKKTIQKSIKIIMIYYFGKSCPLHLSFIAIHYRLHYMPLNKNRAVKRINKQTHQIQQMWESKSNRTNMFMSAFTHFIVINNNENAKNKKWKWIKKNLKKEQYTKDNYCLCESNKNLWNCYKLQLTYIHCTILLALIIWIGVR